MFQDGWKDLITLMFSTSCCMVLIILIDLSSLSYKAFIFGTSFSMPCMYFDCAVNLYSWETWDDIWHSHLF